MSKTTPVFLLRYGDSVAMKDGSTPVSSSAHVASDINDLVNGDANKNFLYATFEPNSWLLDGYSKFVPSTSPKIGFVSDVISDAAGDFTSPILLTITLDAVYTFEQLTRFSFSQISGDYCTELKVEYRNASDVLIDDQIYYPDKYEYRAELPTKPIAGVKYIRVYFYSTNHPYRHLRLLDIGFDDILFRASEIKSAVLVEEISRYSTELRSNTLEVSLFSPIGEFSVVNTTGVFAGLEENQPADMYEEIDSTIHYMGRFYLDKFESPTQNKMNLTLKDGIALLDKSKFMGNFYSWDLFPYRTIYSDDLISEIMAAAGLDFEIDVELENIEMNGVLHIGDCRKALQQVLFAIGAYATCSRSNKVIIKKSFLSTDIVTPDYELTAANKGMTQSVELKPLVTSLDLKYSEYVEENAYFGSGFSTNTKVVFDGTLEIGSYTIDLFPDICVGLGTVGTPTATITQYPFNTYIRVVCTAPGTWNTHIYGYVRSKKWENVVSLGGVTDNNRITINDANFVSVHNRISLINELFDYYQERYVQKIRTYAIPLKPGHSVVVDTYSSKQIQGFVERVRTDLAGGFISDVEIVGVLL